MTEFPEALKTTGIAIVLRLNIRMACTIQIPAQSGWALLVWFTSDEVCDNVFKQRTKLKILPAKIYINEDLIKDDAQKLSRARVGLKEGHTRC